MAINVSSHRPSTANLSTSHVSNRPPPTKVATASTPTLQHNSYHQDTFEPATSGDVDGVNAAKHLLPRLENTINATGAILDSHPDRAITFAQQRLAELYKSNAVVFPGLAAMLGSTRKKDLLGAEGMADLLMRLQSRDSELHVGTGNGKSGVSEVYGLPDSTEEQGEFVMISRGTRGKDPYTTAEAFKYEKTPEGLRITSHTMLEDIKGHVSSQDPKLQKHLGQGGTAR
jgi:hypothetical protein